MLLRFSCVAFCSNNLRQQFLGCFGCIFWVDWVVCGGSHSILRFCVLKKCVNLKNKIVLVCFKWFWIVSCLCRFLQGVSFVLGCVTLFCCFSFFCFCKLCQHVSGCSDRFFVCCGLCWDASVVSGCLGCFGPPWDVLVVLGCSALRSDVLSLCMLFSSCFELLRLFPFVFGCAWLCEAVLIRVGLVLPFFFVCSGLFSQYSIVWGWKKIFFRLQVRLFHDVPHCSGCFVSVQVVGTIWFFYVVLFVRSFCMLDRSLL